VSAPTIANILETIVYVDDMARARAFYEGVMGLEAGITDEFMTAYRVGNTVLLLFVRGSRLENQEMPNGDLIPPHDGLGPVHFAFAAAQEDMDAWREHLEANGVAVISTVRWERSGTTSLYFHDPDGHVVELASPELWGIS
jgi:catechol 2,3-dioxygenase-like lactoylglutathione lyase family enzyme